MMRCLPLVALALLCPLLAEAAPTVFWASDPVRAGETVIVVGDGLAGARVTVAPYTTKPGPARVVPLIQPSDGSLKFVIPGDLKSNLFQMEIVTPSGKVVQVLNRPQVWWAQGFMGKVEGVPGEPLRILGKNLKFGVQGTVKLTGPKTVTLRSVGDSYSVSVDLPRDLPVGQYSLVADNGVASEPVKVTVRKAVQWPASRYDVVQYGADALGQADSTEAIRQAMAAAAAKGGGVVYFPRGRYMVSGTLEIPRFVTLQGEQVGDVNLVNVFWADVKDPLPVQIKGTNSFAIESLTFYCGNYSKFLVADDKQPDAGDVRLDHVMVRANCYRGHMTADEVDRRMRTGGGNQRPLLTMGGRNVCIMNCDLLSSGMAFWFTKLQAAYIANYIFRNGRWGWYSFSGSDGVIFEDNQIIGGDLMSTGGGLNCLNGVTYSQHVYYARNKLSNMLGWDREAMTSDAGGGAYFGKVASSTPTVVTLGGDTTGNRDWTGGGIYILDGKGSGQYRRIAGMKGREVTVAQPWQVPPDTTSTVTVCAYQGRCLFIGNDFADNGISLQFYGNALEHICAANTCARSVGYHNFGMHYSGGYQPNWYLQWLDNTITEGNLYWGDQNNWRLSGEGHIGVYAFPRTPNWVTPLTLGTTVRRNRLLNNAHIMLGSEWRPESMGVKGRHVRDVVVEGNLIKHADLGVYAFPTAEGVVIRNNEYEDVRRPLDGAGLAGAWVTSAERAAALRMAMQALSEDLGFKGDIVKLAKLGPMMEALEKAPDGSTEQGKVHGEALLAVLAAVAQARPEGLPFAQVAPHLGMSLRMPWETALHRDLQNRPQGGPSQLDVIVTATNLGEPVMVSAEAMLPEAWHARPSEAKELTDQAPVTLSMPMVVPEKEWAGHEVPVTVSVKLGEETLRLHETIRAGSGYIRKWMLLGPFANKGGQALDRALYPPDDGVDLAGEYDGATGKIKWQAWENGDWIKFRDLYKYTQPGTAYAVACVNSPKEMAAELRMGASGGVVATVNGEVVFMDDKSHRAGPRQMKAPTRLRQGDNVIMLKLSTNIEEWTAIGELGPAPGGEPLTGVTVVSPKEFAGQACFAPPKRREAGAEEPKYTGGVKWRLVHADNFDRTALGARWQIGSGTWKIEQGVLQSSGTAFLCYAEKVAAPVRIEYESRAMGQPGDLSACWLTKPDDHQSGVLFGFGSNGNTLCKLVVNGEQVAQADKPVVQQWKWHHVIAQVLPGGRMQLIVDGTMALDQAGAPGDAKDPGIWSWGANGEFRKVRVYGL
ncbi:MAG: glycosyl hydrolase family 28-related protein [Armatimonadia bacterium]